ATVALPRPPVAPATSTTRPSSGRSAKLKLKHSVDADNSRAPLIQERFVSSARNFRYQGEAASENRSGWSAYRDCHTSIARTGMKIAAPSQSGTSGYTSGVYHTRY